MSWLKRSSIPLALLAIVALALAMRGLAFEWVFQGDVIAFRPADPQYHLRRAFYTFINFPQILLFDPYINYPGGSAVPWPPLYDFIVGAVARLWASDSRGFEVIAAWASPLFASLTVIPIYLAGRLLAPPGLAIAAAAFFALIPISVQFSAVGYADHHSAVAMIGAWLLYLCMAMARPQAAAGTMAWLGVGLCVARLSLLYTWHGSLLYLGLVEATLFLMAVISGSRSLPLVQGASALATALGILPLLLISPTPVGGPYSSIAISWLHVLAMLVTAALSALVFVLNRMHSSWSISRRAGWVVFSGVSFIMILLLFPGPREGLVPALQFLTLSDGSGNAVGEQGALFALFGRAQARSPELDWGWFAYLLPLAPIAPLFFVRRFAPESGSRFAAAVLGIWTSFFVVLAILQRRYGSDLAPAASIAFVLMLAVFSRWIMARASPTKHLEFATILVAVMIWAGLMAPAISRVYVPRVRSSWAALTEPAEMHERTRTSVSGTLTRFLAHVRRVTPDTRSYLESGPDPEYGIIAEPNLGHAIQYVARRATATDPFWSYIGQANWDLTARFGRAEVEEEALALARQLRGRYVITMPMGARRTVTSQLQLFDGVADRRGRRPLEHFRLVTEYGEPGRAINSLWHGGKQDGAPYKLFEIVEGALLRVTSGRKQKIDVSLALRTEAGREFEYRAVRHAAERGTVEFRLPYSTEGTLPVRALRPYRVIVDERSYDVEVPERSVLQGEVIVLEAGF